jgi:predicted nicotinamide N-methyase
MDDLVEEVVAIAGHDLALLRPRDPDSLLSQEAYERDEFLPYWAELWPSALALARMVAARTLRGARVLELGCGLGLPSLAAALAGGRVLATDWSAAALELLAGNAARNGVALDTMRVDWTRPEELLARGPFPLVLAADVLYERRNVPVLLELLPRLVGQTGEVWLADPGRATADTFLTLADAEGWAHRATPDRDRPGVVVHRFTP